LTRLPASAGADLPAGERDRGAVAEVLGTRRLQRVEVGGSREGLLGAGDRVVERGLVEQRHLFGVVVFHPLSS
jgi:hypothetical protein